MAIGSGLGAQIGFAAEATPGTAETVTRFLDFISETLSPDVRMLEHFAPPRGRVLRTGRGKHYTAKATGNVAFTVMTKGFGLIFQHMLGAGSVVQQGATDEYLHTLTADLTAGHWGKSLTAQVGRPDVGGTVRPHTYEGCKITGWELKCQVDGKLELTIELDGEGETTATALAAASYASGDDFFIFTEGGVSLDSTPIPLVKGFTLRGQNALDVERRGLGGTRLQPIANGEMVISGDLDLEWEALTRHAAWKAGTEIADLVFTFDTGVAIPSGDGGNYSLVITLPLVRLTKAGTNVAGAEVLKEGVSFKSIYNGTDNPCTFAYTTTDTAL